MEEIACRPTGCSAVWLARHVRDVEVGGSNPPSPTDNMQVEKQTTLEPGWSIARPSRGWTNSTLRQGGEALGGWIEPD